MDASVKTLLLKRADNACEYCRLPQKWYSPYKLQVEHIIARQHHGGDELDNLGIACIDCNLNKGPNIAGIDPLSLTLTELFHPRRHIWSDHFEQKRGMIAGRSSIGRTTVYVLKMNSDEQVKTRLIIELFEAANLRP